MSNSYDNIYKLIKFTNSKVDYFEGTKKYISTGDSDDIENGQEVTFDNKPSRANVMGSAGDILIAKMANTNKVILLDNDTQNNIYSTGFYCLNSTKLFNKYLFYLLSNDEFNKEKDSWSFGTTQVSLNENGFKRIKINFVSDIIKQMKISKFLDKKVLLLDKILENQQQQIEKLKEYKQSLISEVVTKGLDSNISFKDSGIKWIGKIPKHWDILQLKRIGKVVNGSTPKSDNSMFWDGEIYWATPTDFKDGQIIDNTARKITNLGYSSCNTTLVKKGSILITCRAPIGNVAINDKDMCFNQGCKAIVTNIDNRYFYYFLVCMNEPLNIHGQGTTFLEISTNSLSNFMIVYPAESERNLIANYLDMKINEIDAIISIKTKKIEKLKEYKKSLIYEYVTGKKEVS